MKDEGEAQTETKVVLHTELPTKNTERKRKNQIQGAG